jgi:hypothetical protein
MDASQNDDYQQEMPHTPLQAFLIFGNPGSTEMSL